LSARGGAVRAHERLRGLRPRGHPGGERRPRELLHRPAPRAAGETQRLRVLHRARAPPRRPLRAPRPRRAHAGHERARLARAHRVQPRSGPALGGQPAGAAPLRLRGGLGARGRGPGAERLRPPPPPGPRPDRQHAPRLREGGTAVGFVRTALMAAALAAAAASTPGTPEKYHRSVEQTFLTYPEWFLVSSPAEYARFIDGHPPSDFPFFAHIGQLWRSYGAVRRAIGERHYPKNPGYHVMIVVIGVSTTVEYTLKAAYETLF